MDEFLSRYTNTIQFINIISTLNLQPLKQWQPKKCEVFDNTENILKKKNITLLGKGVKFSVKWPNLMG